MRRIPAVKRSLFLVAGIAVSVATVSACDSTAVVGGDRAVRLALTEYRLVPQSLRAKAGLLTIVVHNDGRLTHKLTVSRDGTVIGQTPPVTPGASTQLTLTLAPGQYQMASTLFSDQVLGAYGTLTIG